MKDSFYDVATVILAALGITAAVVYLLFGTGFKQPDSGPSDSASATITGDEVDRRFVLKAVPAKGYAYRGISDSIQSTLNPRLVVKKGQTVAITLINGQALPHDLVLPAFDRSTGNLYSKGKRKTFRFRATKTGQFKYYCSVGSHRQAGMAGVLIVR